MKDFKVFWNDELTAEVKIETDRVQVKRYTTHPFKQIFPKDSMSRYTFGQILAARCWEEKRDDLPQILKQLNLKEYNIYEVLLKTHGVSYNDSIWFEFEGENLNSDQVLVKKDKSFYRHFDDSMKVDIDGTSEGAQSKYYSGGYWYKTDSCGGEAYSECLTSLLLESSNLKSSEYVVYEFGQVNHQNACRSKNFLSNGEEFITLYRLFLNTTGRRLPEQIHKMDSMEEQIQFVLHFVQETTGTDLTHYFANIFALDCLILNEDRHFNNLGLIFNGESFREAPIFDNGKSLFVGNYSINHHLPIKENLKRVISKPFFGTHEQVYQYFKNDAELKIDLQDFQRRLGESNLPDSLQKKVLLANLQEHQELWKRDEMQTKKKSPGKCGR